MVTDKAGAATASALNRMAQALRRQTSTLAAIEQRLASAERRCQAIAETTTRLKLMAENARAARARSPRRRGR